MNDRDTGYFSADVHHETVSAMKSRGERVHDKAEEVYQQTGQLDPNVAVKYSIRESRNAFTRNADGKTCTLSCGIKLPIITCTDGTASMGENVAKAFESMEELFGMLNQLKGRYHVDLSEAVVQDVGDRHDVFQMAQFESDNRAAEHVRLLYPDKNGLDWPEDYDLGLCYVDQAVRTDIVQYGLKGYFFIIADAIGRDFVTPELAWEKFGLKIQGNQSTRSICQSLLKKWHVYFIQVKNDSTCHDWWSERLGRNRIVSIPRPSGHLLAQIEAGLIYVTENSQPSLEGLKKFLSFGSQETEDVRVVWEYLQSVRDHFGDQARLSGYKNIPNPGDIFAHYRDPWPIGHPRANENPSQSESSPSVETSPADPTIDEIPWDRL